MVKDTTEAETVTIETQSGRVGSGPARFPHDLRYMEGIQGKSVAQCLGDPDGLRSEFYLRPL